MWIYLFTMLFVLIVFVAIKTYLKTNRIEKQKAKFEQVKISIKNQGISSRNTLLNNSQQSNLEELASIVREHLNEFRLDIPPRLFQNAEDSINNYVENLKFNQLYDLYEILINTKKKLVFQQLNRFFNWGYIQ